MQPNSQIVRAFFLSGFNFNDGLNGEYRINPSVVINERDVYFKTDGSHFMYYFTGADRWHLAPRVDASGVDLVSCAAQGGFPRLAFSDSADDVMTRWMEYGGSNDQWIPARLAVHIDRFQSHDAKHQMGLLMAHQMAQMQPNAQSIRAFFLSGFNFNDGLNGEYRINPSVVINERDVYFKTDGIHFMYYFTGADRWHLAPRVDASGADLVSFASQGGFPCLAFSDSADGVMTRWIEYGGSNDQWIPARLAVHIDRGNGFRQEHDCDANVVAPATQVPLAPPREAQKQAPATRPETKRVADGIRLPPTDPVTPPRKHWADVLQEEAPTPSTQPDVRGSRGEVAAGSTSARGTHRRLVQKIRKWQAVLRDAATTEATASDTLDQLRGVNMTVDLLRKTLVGKTVAKMAKHGCHAVSKKARALVDTWKTVWRASKARETPASRATTLKRSLAVRKQMSFRADPEEARGTFEAWARRAKSDGKPVPELRNLNSDFVVFREVLSREAYGTGPAVGADKDMYFGIHLGDITLDLGSNWGAFTFFAWGKGVRAGDCYEPSPHCHTVLEPNLSTLNTSFDSQFTLRKRAVATQDGIGQLDDHTHCARCGGSARSAVVGALSAICKGQLVPITLVGFQNAITDTTTVVKMDVEGSDVAILSSGSFNWKQVRVFLVELSLNQLRREHPAGDGWRVFAKIVKHLKTGGFTHASMPKWLKDPQCWRKPQSSSDRMRFRRYAADPILMFYRPAGGNQPPNMRAGARPLGWEQCLQTWATMART